MNTGQPCFKKSASAAEQLKTLLIVAILAVTTGLVTGCANPEKGKTTKKEVHIWPVWPDQPRFEFEAVLGTEASIVVETSNDRLQRVLAGVPRSNRAVIDKPSAIAARAGRVYVAEPAVKAITVLDGARGKLFRFGVRPPNLLERPQALSIDAAGSVYVLDSGLRRVMIFDNFGLFKYSISVREGFTNPVGLAVDPSGQTIYVVDRGDLSNDDHKVVAFSPSGVEKFRLGARGSEPGQFNIPLDATVSPDGTLLVADTGNARIQAFSSEGKFLFSFGGFGVDPGRFSRPRSVATDSEGNIYVADGGFNNVQIFNPKGELLMPIGRLSQTPGPGNYSLVGSVAVDEANRLFVTDNFFKKIDVFRRLSDEEGKKMLADSNAESK